MLSPIFRVREFHVHDITHYPIKVQWLPIDTDPDDETELTVFSNNNAIPSTKVLSFYRRQPFQVDAVYAQPELIPTGIDPYIARFEARDVPVDPRGDATIVKVKTRLNTHNILSFESAYVEELIEEREEPSPAQMDIDQPAADGSAAVGDADGAQQQPSTKKKRTVKKKDIPFEAIYKCLDKVHLEDYKEKEIQMHAHDKLVQDTEDKKNALEEYVYDMRGKLDDRFSAFVRSDEKTNFLSSLAEAEDWLYTEEGEDASKSAYTTRLDSLKSLGDPITFRYREHEDRPKYISSLRETLNKYMSDATSSEERYNHIDAKDKQAVVEKVATVQKWLEDMIARQAERAKAEDPALTGKEVEKKKDDVVYFATPILSKPKPKPPVPGSGTQTPRGEKQDSGEGNKQQQQQPEENPETKPTDEGTNDMDVD